MTSVSDFPTPPADESPSDVDAETASDVTPPADESPSDTSEVVARPTADDQGAVEEGAPSMAEGSVAAAAPDAELNAMALA